MAGNGGSIGEWANRVDSDGSERTVMCSGGRRDPGKVEGNNGGVEGVIFVIKHPGGAIGNIPLPPLPVPITLLPIPIPLIPELIPQIPPVFIMADCCTP